MNSVIRVQDCWSRSEALADTQSMPVQLTRYVTINNYTIWVYLLVFIPSTGGICKQVLVPQYHKILGNDVGSHIPILSTNLIDCFGICLLLQANT